MTHRFLPSVRVPFIAGLMHCHAAQAQAGGPTPSPPGAAVYFIGLKDGDTLLGTVGGAPVYIGRAQGEAWAHTQLILDVVPGRGGMFSLDNGREQRFLTRGRVFTDAERAALSA